MEAMSTTEVSTIQDVFDVPAFINSRRVGAVQYGIIILCGLIMFLDGFDTQAISYMAPLIANEWGFSREVLGPIFLSALNGLMVGYLVLSPQASNTRRRERAAAAWLANSANELIDKARDKAREDDGCQRTHLLIHVARSGA
jgi:hypothetical protein